MKIAGIILIVLQVLSLIPALAAGENIFGNGGANLIGRFFFGILGVFLLFLAKPKPKQNEGKDDDSEDDDSGRWE